MKYDDDDDDDDQDHDRVVTVMFLLSLMFVMGYLLGSAMATDTGSPFNVQKCFEGWSCR